MRVCWIFWRVELTFAFRFFSLLVISFPRLSLLLLSALTAKRHTEHLLIWLLFLLFWLRFEEWQAFELFVLNPIIINRFYLNRVLIILLLRLNHSLIDLTIFLLEFALPPRLLIRWVLIILMIYIVLLSLVVLSSLLIVLVLLILRSSIVTIPVILILGFVLRRITTWFVTSLH